MPAGPEDRKPETKSASLKPFLKTKVLKELSNQGLEYLLDLKRCQDIKGKDTKRLTKSKAYPEDKRDCVRNPRPKHSRE